MALTPPMTTASYLEAANNPKFILPENERRPAYKPRASGLIGCARQQMYSLSNAPTTDLPHPDSIVTQELGRLAEEYTKLVVTAAESPLVEPGWEGLALRAGWRGEGKQDALPDDYFVTGHPDGDLHQRRFVETAGGGRRNEYKETLADGLRWGAEHKLYGAYTYKKIILGSNILESAPGLVGQGLLYGDALGWDAVQTFVLAADAALIRGEIRNIRKYAQEGKAKETRERNAALLKQYEGRNPKVHVDFIDIRTLKAAFIPDLKRRADAISELRRAETNPDLVMRERNPDKHPLCGYCEWATRCREVGQGSIAVPESPLVEE